MKLTIDIDITNSKALALLNFLKTLDFIEIKKAADWWEELSQEQINAVNKGLEDLENGNTHADEEVRKSIRNRILKAKKIMKIIWSEQAKNSYEKIIDFILEQWNSDIALDFESKTNTLLDKLKQNKNLCPASKKTKLRKCVIHKNTSLIYKINNPNIELVTFIDNRSQHNF